MPNLVKRLLLGAAILAIGAFTSCKLPNPVPPPIVPNTNTATRTALSVNPSGGPAPFTTRIKVDGTDEQGSLDIKKYQAFIDLGNDGTIEETITQSTPIDVTRTFNYVGNVMIYGQCTDSGGLTDKKGLEIIVSAPSLGSPPTGTLTANPSSGEFPLTVEIKYFGTPKDGKSIANNIVQIDEDEDGSYDETISQSSPIDITRTFSRVENVRIYGQSTDSAGLVSNRENVEVTIFPRTDLVANMTLLSASYHVGSKFDYSEIVQNNTSEDIILDNSNKNNLEYRLVKEDGAVIFDNKLDESFMITLHGSGTVKFEYNNSPENNVKFTLNNAYLTFGDFNGDIIPSIFPNGFSIEATQPSYIFTESGNYHLETEAIYSRNNQNYTAVFQSPTFSVGD